MKIVTHTESGDDEGNIIIGPRLLLVTQAAKALNHIFFLAPPGNQSSHPAHDDADAQHEEEGGGSGDKEVRAPNDEEFGPSDTDTKDHYAQVS